MPRYARFFRPADDDAAHEKQLAEFSALGPDQQRFVLGCLLYDVAAGVSAHRKALDEFRGEMNAHFGELAKLGELFGDDGEEARAVLPRGEDEEAHQPDEAAPDTAAPGKEAS